MPARTRVSFLSSFGRMTLNLDPAATYSTTAGCRPARLKNGRKEVAFWDVSETSMIRGRVISLVEWMPRASVMALQIERGKRAQERETRSSQWSRRAESKKTREKGEEERDAHVCSATTRASMSGERSSSSLRCLRTEANPFSINTAAMLLNKTNTR
jgi:hypothetical protein